MIREMQRLACYSKDGSHFTVVIYQKFIQHKPLSGKVSEKPGSISARLSDGSDVNILDDEFNSFEVVQIGQIITRVDRG